MKTTAASNRTLYLVTGAAGFLGGTVCRQLVARGDRVRAFVLPGDKAERYVPAEAEICEGDLTDPASLRRFFAVEDGITVNVIHCASIVTVNPDYSQKVMDVNVGGTKNIIDCCLAVKNFGKLVYVSSTGAIPEQPKGRKNRRSRSLRTRARPRPCPRLLQPEQSAGYPGRAQRRT